MPWKETHVVDERMKFIVAVQNPKRPVCVAPFPGNGASRQDSVTQAPGLRLPGGHFVSTQPVDLSPRLPV